MPQLQQKMSKELQAPAAVGTPRSAGHGLNLLGALAVLSLLLLVFGPLFVCLPLGCDLAFFDVCAESILRGEPFCRDIEIHGTAGAVFLHTAVRTLVGWRSEPLRVVDLLLVGFTVWLLVSRFLPQGFSLAGRLWAAIILLLFYFSTTEGIHCQPDMRMLLLSVGALCLRQKQIVTLLEGPVSTRQVALRAFGEGVLWGLAFLIKPFAALPAQGCWGITLALSWQDRQRLKRPLIRDACGLIAGGLAVGVATLAWFYFSGNLGYYIEGNLKGWNKEYYKSSPTLVQRVSGLFGHFWPWSLIHLAAVPAALVALDRALASRGANSQSPAPERVLRPLLAVFYLGWFIQANFIQWQFDYHVAATVLLGLAVLLNEPWLLNRWAARLAVPAFLLWALWLNPLLQPRHLALWERCWREGSSADVRDHLALKATDIWTPNWVDLEAVAAYLKAHGVGDREVTCYSLSTLHLYPQLHIKPATRFVMLQAWLFFFPSHRAEMMREVEASPQRYIVTDLVHLRSLTADQVPPSVRRPEHVVFQAGRYLVHRVVKDTAMAPAPH
jgi:hypothetical protein